MFELSSSLGWLWLTFPPVLPPVHETMCIFHVRSRELTHLERLPPRWGPGLLTALLSSSDRSIWGEVWRCVRRGGTKGWVVGPLEAVQLMPGACKKHGGGGWLRASASLRGSPLVSEHSPDTLGWLDPTNLSHCLSQPSILHACHSDALCFTWNHSWDTRCLRYSVLVVVSFPQPGKPTPPHFKP